VTKRQEPGSVDSLALCPMCFYVDSLEEEFGRAAAIRAAKILSAKPRDIAP
jgi:hypothetical protein